MSRKRKVEYQTPSVNLSNYGSYDENETISQILIRRIRNTALFATGDQVAPSAILWTDPERLWEYVMDDLMKQMPELYFFGPYSPECRVGPAIWLRCIEARSIPTSHPQESVPVFYLPGVSKRQLDDAENCPVELQPLVEYEYRGSLWHHPNGRDWTPFAFMTSEKGGLELDISKDESTKNALQRALPVLIKAKVGTLRKDRIDADYINHLLAPDFPQAILSWLNSSKAFKNKSKEAWAAFVDQSEKEFGFHPEKDGELRAAQLLAQRKEPWDCVWDRFKEAPQNYPGVIKFLSGLDPPLAYSNEDELEPYVQINDAQEKKLSEALLELKSKRRDEVALKVNELEKTHGHRREWVWTKTGRSQLALALEHMVTLSKRTDKPLNASNANDLAELYNDNGKEVDAELLGSLACCLTREQEEPIKVTSQALYLDWLDKSSSNLQELIKRGGNRIQPRLEKVKAVRGRIILFVDGLRLDLASRLVQNLSYQGFQTKMEWDWSPFPSITQTSKYYVSPISHLLEGKVDLKNVDLAPALIESGQPITQDRFEELMKKNGIQVVDNSSNGDPRGTGWTESGTIDQFGHTEQWQLSRRLQQEIADLTLRVESLIKTGWEEVLIVTDHGWLLVPNGLTKIDLPKYLTDLKWGRCAIMKETAETDLQLIPWYWNDMVSVASPRGACCFRSGVEFSHGGISLQELVVPRISVKRDNSASSNSKIVDHRWIGLRCHVIVSNPTIEEKVDIRARVADPESSFIEGREPRSLSSDGTASLPIANPDDEGKEGFIVLLNKQGEALHSVMMRIGGSA